MTKYRMSIEIHADDEGQAKVFYEKVKDLHEEGATLTGATGYGKEYWTVSIDQPVDGMTLDELRKQLDLLESIERTL